MQERHEGNVRRLEREHREAMCVVTEPTRASVHCIVCVCAAVAPNTVVHTVLQRLTTLWCCVTYGVPAVSLSVVVDPWASGVGCLGEEVRVGVRTCALFCTVVCRK